MIVIINYGLGNLNSIKNMLIRLGKEAVITSDPKEIMSADKIILPGVGAFDTGITNLEKLKLISPLNEAVLKHKKHLLGICLGAQLLLDTSDEGKLGGLGLISGKVVSFKSKFKEEGINLPVPNMGWRGVTSNTDISSFNLSSDFRFYFVHSYYFEIKNQKNNILNSKYGIDFCAGFQEDNIFGVQFHPEKSHKFGFDLMRQFLDYV